MPFGSARVSVDPACPLENLVLPYLTGGKSLPEPVTIFFFGDSLDAQARASEELVLPNEFRAALAPPQYPRHVSAAVEARSVPRGLSLLSVCPLQNRCWTTSA